MNAEIITVGMEQLPEDSTSSNSEFLSHELAAYGIPVTHLSAVSDDRTYLTEALHTALSRSELIVLSGGMDENRDGSGSGGEVSSALNNYTRDVVCEALGIPLELHEESWERVREFFLNTSREMPADSQKQAMLPTGCTVFPNEHGIASGCVITRSGQLILLLPGAPRELFPMFSDYVAPFLSNYLNGTIVSRTMGVFGLSETVLIERLADLMSEANPAVASYAKDGEAILRVTARAADRQAALALCNTVVEEINKRLGVNVYGVDVGSLQKSVVVLLLDKQMKIATAESCTAGLLSGRLTEVSGASAVFECGVAAYSPEIKHNILGVSSELLNRVGAVSPEVASAMAVGVRRVGNASLGVSITGVAGPDPSEGKPVGTVYIALADEKRVWVKKIDAQNGTVDRESIRILATSHALDLVRRYLEALPTVMAGGELYSGEPAPADIIPKGRTTRIRRGIPERIFPWKGDSKTEIIRKISIIASFILLVTAFLMVFYFHLFRQIDNEYLYDKLEALYSVSNSVASTNNAGYPGGMLTQFYALYSRNSDVRGWVTIKDTSINYPVMRNPGQAYYGTHNFDKEDSSYGVPYFDSSAALESIVSANRSLLIYGNNSRDGQMFSNLTKYYNDPEYLVAHPLIEMNTVYQAAEWKIFSVMVVSSNDTGYNYVRNQFADETEFLSFAGEISARSLYSIPAGQADVQEGDTLLLLSTNIETETNFSGAQLIVAARQVRSGESETVDLSGTVRNSSAIMPMGWNGSTAGNQQYVPTTSKRTYATTATAYEQSSDTEQDTASTDISVSTTGNSTQNSATVSGNTTETETSEKSTTSTTTATTTTTTTTETTTTATGSTNEDNDRLQSAGLLLGEESSAESGTP